MISVSLSTRLPVILAALAPLLWQCIRVPDCKPTHREGEELTACSRVAYLMMACTCHLGMCTASRLPQEGVLMNKSSSIVVSCRLVTWPLLS